MKQRIPFVGPSSPGRSVNADCQRTLNCYLEMDNSTPRAPVALYGTPGLTLVATIGGGPIRAMFRHGDAIMVISGSAVFKATPGWATAYLGSIGTSSGPVGIASNGTQLLIVDGTAGWIISLSTWTMALVSDPDFPAGVKRATYQDGYFIVTGDSSQKFYINEMPNDGTAWNGLDFASAEGSPDYTIGCISDHREIWLFGDDSVELWINNGNADFPFERSGNTFIEVGCAAADTICKADNTVYWMGKDDRGGPTVWKAQGYTPIRVSTSAVEKSMQSYATVSDARAWSYQQEGHTFYVLSFPSADKTWVYDVATGQWHERSSLIAGVDRMWRAACHVFWNLDNLVGDYASGAIYKMDLDSYLDAGNPIKRLRTTQAMESTQNRVFYSSLQVDMETGVGGTLEMSYSNDGGHTWKDAAPASLGSTGAYGTRAIYRRLGYGRNRVWRISTESNAKFAVLGAVANIENGDH